MLTLILCSGELVMCQMMPHCHSKIDPDLLAFALHYSNGHFVFHEQTSCHTVPYGLAA